MININLQITKYWQKTPEFFSEKYKTSVFEKLSPIGLFLQSRRSKVMKLAPNVKGKRILDVGCGSGTLMIDLLKKGAFVVGIDYSKKMLQFAQNELDSQKILKKDYKLLMASADKLPFKKDYFDIILATGLTDYLTDDQNEKFIKEAARVLKKKGTLIISFPVDKSPFSFARSGFGLLIRQKLFKLPPIRNQFSLNKINVLLEEVKLTIFQKHKIFSTMWIIIAKFKQ